jgi:hypothetical protein
MSTASYNELQNLWLGLALLLKLSCTTGAILGLPFVWAARKFQADEKPEDDLYWRMVGIAESGESEENWRKVA